MQGASIATRRRSGCPHGILLAEALAQEIERIGTNAVPSVLASGILTRQTDVIDGVRRALGTSWPACARRSARTRHASTWWRLRTPRARHGQTRC